ncbi:iron-sulfur cluster assembly scaffold protein [bacterium]|nr:iron-sulfur cluster assembly scaffold protein [bacterium]
MSDLYARENMLDHIKNPRNRGKMVNADIKTKVVNRHCGDILSLYANIEAGKIKKITFDGDGCAVAMSSASMILEDIQGIDLKNLSKVTKKQVLKNFGQDLTPSRQNCALLVLEGLQQLNKKLNKNAKKDEE